jgi:dipeptidyl aminopeptidase/acylaminoacyl peptidase
MIQIHGGPDFRERATFRGRSNYLLNELGVAIIYPNVRGSAGFGRAFQDLDNGKGREGAIKDIGALLDWVAARPELDKDRIVLNGVSYGAWLALEGGIVYNDRIRGVIEGAGITDFNTFLEQTEAARRDNRRLEYGDESDPQMREYLKSISPVTRASELRKPTLLIQAGKDTRVPVEQGRQLMQAMQASKTPVWYLEYPDANHDNLGQLGGDYLIASWMWFFRNFVLNYPEGLRPSDSPTRSLTRRFAASLRSRGSLAHARSHESSGRFIRYVLTQSARGPDPCPARRAAA